MDFFNRNTQRITITRGDSGMQALRMRINKEVYSLYPGDQINFGVKKSYADKECLIKKTYTTNPFVLAIDPADTKNLAFGEYVWDLQFVSANGFTKTLLAKKDFIVTEEVV